MIYSEEQYGISTDQLVKFKEALVAATKQETEGDWARSLEIDALKSQIAELEADLAHYDLLKSGEIAVAKSHSLEALPSTLIQARIAHGLSQSDLAEALDIEPQQVQRYEASEYMGASLAKLIEAANILKVHTAGLFEAEAAHRGMVISWGECRQRVLARVSIQRNGEKAMVRSSTRRRSHRGHQGIFPAGCRPALCFSSSQKENERRDSPQ